MDQQTCDADKLGVKQQSEISFPVIPIIGAWTVEYNRPWGFVIRNVDPAANGTEYHFHFQSNGWITSKLNGEIVAVLGPCGPIGQTPIPVDRESTKKYERIQELQTKEPESLSPAEMRELLELSGLIKGK